HDTAFRDTPDYEPAGFEGWRDRLTDGGRVWDADRVRRAGRPGSSAATGAGSGAPSGAPAMAAR
ncbi:hypothetical protein, partial [Micromonospora humida]|uniref:hypothetical protein n=1 Tax=Micromonospora humida TaxID=2809018 RepID=UPI0033CE0853